MRIAVVTPMMKSGEKGGAENLYDGLVSNLRRTVHEVDQVEVVIDESSFEAILESYSTCYYLDLSRYDLVVSTKAPTYMVRHPNHVSYLLHTIRVFYDMFAREFGDGTPEQQRQRAVIHRLDHYGLHPDRVRRHLANGRETYMRLYQADPFWQQIRFQAVHHPPSLEGFLEPHPGDYIFLPSRLHRWKRVDLVIQAFRRLQQDIRLKISGTGEDEPTLRALAAGDPRIEFLGRVTDEQLRDLYAGALVVPFVPQHEDYGLVTIEAFRSKKPVITCVDSGEPVRFVRDFETGFVVEPEPQALAERFEYFIEHPDVAAAMGRRGCRSVAHITWEAVVAALLGSEAGESELGRRSRTIDLAAGGLAQPAAETYRVAVLDMQPIEPPVGGGRIRLLGLYHGLGKSVPATYVGTYDWPGPKFRRYRHSPTLEEITIPLSDEHFAIHADWQQRAGGKNVIDVSFDLLAHHSPKFVATAREQATGADIVVFSHPWIYPLVKDLLRQRPQLVVYDSQNVESVLRAMLLDDHGFGTWLVKHVAVLEYELCQQADLVLACSQEDRELFCELYGIPCSKILVVPNGTFTGRLLPADETDRQAMKQRLGIGDRPLVIFVGSAYGPNVEAAAFICNTLAPAVPEVTFAICGGVGDALDPATYQRVTNGQWPNILVTGSLSEDDKQAYLVAADLAINPMFSGSGTNIKMFDFMAAGLPIISTPTGARGILQKTETAFHVCQEADFAQTVRRIVENPVYARSLSQAARRLAEQEYSWERISARLGQLLYRTRQRLADPRPFFSVIVATYERHDRLWDLLDCLNEQAFRDFEVILVDQSAEPWTGQDQYSNLDVLYIHTDVKGAVGARNTGAYFARGEVLAFTDDDCLPLLDWLANAHHYFQDPQVVGVEGLLISDKRDDPNYRAVTNIGFEGLGFMTANLFIRRETFLAVGAFDERFDHPHFREDTDLGWRVAERGRIPFGHDVRVYHPPHRRDTEREALAERNRFFEKDALLMAKHPDRYRALFLNEGHYKYTVGFREHFLRGAQKYNIPVEEFYVSLLAAENGAGNGIQGV